MKGSPHTNEHSHFRRLVEYLASKAPPGKLAGRQHVDPTEIAELLAWIMLIDVISQKDAEPRYRIRLVGTEVVKIQGSDGTGKWVEEVLNSDEVPGILEGYAKIIRTHEPGYRRGIVATVGREHVLYRRMVFPLARDGEHVDMLMFVFAPDDGK